jgi:cell division protein FtsQ
MDGGGRNVGPLSAAGQAGDGFAARLLRRLAPARRSRFAPSGQGLPLHIGTLGLAAAFAGIAVAGFVASGRYDAFVDANGRPADILARLGGFGVERVTISGIARLYEHEVLQAAGIDARASVPFLDVAEARERLSRVPLIASVSVRKLYPNEIVINQVEREPAALWQRNGDISVIAADGTVIDEMRDDRYAALPLVVGEGANLRLKDYLGLIESAGPLAERVRAGTFVSGRRWTLKLDGIDIRLPEAGAAEALARLVRIQRDSRILDKDIIAVDLRMPDRVVVRLTEEAAAARAESQKKKPKKATET